MVAAMTAAIVGTSERATIQLAQGRFVRAIIESDHGKLLSLGAGEEALLVALVYDDANLGLVLMAMERAAKQVERIMHEAISALRPSGRNPMPATDEGVNRLPVYLVQGLCRAAD